MDITQIDSAEKINTLIQQPNIKKGNISDGYHSFDELYAHRNKLWILSCRLLQDLSFNNVWRSKKNADGSEWDGWFLLGTSGQDQCTYHLPIELWKETDFALTLDIAPPFDGHTSADVLKRLSQL